MEFLEKAKLCKRRQISDCLWPRGGAERDQLCHEVYLAVKTEDGMLLTSKENRPGMPLIFLHCTGQLQRIISCNMSIMSRFRKPA